MIRDLFYRQIIDGLNSTLDPELFEQCVADLLRTEYPTLVPIRGGSDSGMDGAVADGQGEASPLITTTGDDAVGNLTRNLKRYVEDGGTRTRIIFATSHQLTGRRRNNLLARASRLGFTLIQIYDQAALADRLYRSPEWCQELLNLSGSPPALSILPKTQRPLLSLPLIGRDSEFQWLADTEGDRLIVGQPGSGKSYLLHLYAKENHGLFAVSSDIGEIANCFRRERPRLIIVDDAHTPQNLKLIESLKHFRETTGAEFDIVASSWPDMYRESASEALALPDSKSRELKLLSRDEIVKVIKAAGISGDSDPIHEPINQLTREIVNQAEGRPGLAATLTHLFLQGDVRRIISGDALSRSILHFFLPTLDYTPKQILASFSIGGEVGLSITAVASILAMSVPEIHNTVAGLHAGGVIAVVENNVSVRPAALRFALIREVFGSQHLSLPVNILDQLVQDAPYLPEVARTLIGATARGAIIPREMITEVIEQLKEFQAIGRPTLTGSWVVDAYDDILKMYAWLGRDETSWVLNRFPERITTVAWAVLENAPDIALPMLLDAAIGDNRPLNSHPEHPLRIIEDWIKTAYPGTEV